MPYSRVHVSHLNSRNLYNGGGKPWESGGNSQPSAGCWKIYLGIKDLGIVIVLH